MRLQIFLLLLILSMGSPAVVSAQPIATAAVRIAPGRMVRAIILPSHLQGRRTADGERYDPDAMTAAHPWLPLGSRVAVRNPANDVQLVLTITDRGPFGSEATFAVSEAAGYQLGMLPDEPVPLVIQGTEQAPTRRETTATPVPPTASATPSTDAFAIQLASFSVRSAADAYVVEILGSWVRETLLNDAVVFRVYYGLYGDRLTAERWKTKLKTRGIEGFVKQIRQEGSAAG